MNGSLIGGICCALVVVQFLLCVFGKKWIVKLIPILVILALMIACFAAYLCSGQTNWAFLILILSGLLSADAAVWVIYGLFLLIKKLAKKTEV